MTTPPVTVLMCVYNGEAEVGEAIDSILAQSHRDFEFLIIDDGSTDATPGIIASYDDSRIRILRNPENRGLTYSLNAGLREARGPLVARQDADDISYPDRLSRQLAFLESNPEIAAVGTQFDSIDERGRRLRSHLWMKCETSLGIRWQLMFENPFVHTAVMFRRDVVLDRLGGYDERFRTNQDFELWSRLGLAYPLANLHESLVACRGRRLSLSARYSSEAIRVVCDVLLNNAAATIGSDPLARESVDSVLRGMIPRLSGPPVTLEPLVLWIDSAYGRFVQIWPEAAHLREIRVQSASLIVRLATSAANVSPLKMIRWYLTAARYDLPTFAHGALRFAGTTVRALAGHAPRVVEPDEKSLNAEGK
ncbi:MAG: glycosyltransferase family 2 protein [Thermoanaerobaculia bacterium]